MSIKKYKMMEARENGYLRKNGHTVYALFVLMYIWSCIFQQHTTILVFYSPFTRPLDNEMEALQRKNGGSNRHIYKLLTTSNYYGTYTCNNK